MEKKKIYHQAAELRDHLIPLKNNAQKIVFTNGCFDIVHEGHVELLRQAAKMGDRLIVGLNSDESVKRLKGPSRPINSLTSRLKVLAAFEMVDYLIAFETATPEELIHQLNPDVLVKGGDYTIDTIVGAEHVIASGGEVKIVELLSGFSSSKIIDKLNT